MSWRGHFKFRNNYLDFEKRKSCMSTLNSKSKNGLKLFDCYLVNYLDSSGGKSLWRILTSLPLPPGNPDTNQLYFEIYIHEKVDWISMYVGLSYQPWHGITNVDRVFFWEIPILSQKTHLGDFPEKYSNRILVGKRLNSEFFYYF